jgi:hypothetical protein
VSGFLDKSNYSHSNNSIVCLLFNKPLLFTVIKTSYVCSSINLCYQLIVVQVVRFAAAVEVYGPLVWRGELERDYVVMNDGCRKMDL